MEVLFFDRLQPFCFRRSCAYFVISLYYVRYHHLIRYLIACRVAFLAVILFVGALIMRYGTVVYSVPEGDIGYHLGL